MEKNDKKIKVDLGKHWFWGVILQNKGIYTHT